MRILSAVLVLALAATFVVSQDAKGNKGAKGVPGPGGFPGSSGPPGGQGGR
ncbi:Hypothetical predicted protein, partial [Paramuricea clavata]